MYLSLCNISCRTIVRHPFIITEITYLRDSVVSSEPAL